MSLKNAIKRAQEKRKARGWDRTYWAIDLHDTILPSSYKKDNHLEFYPDAEAVLQMLSESEEDCLILFTSSYFSKLVPVFKFFKEHGIKFDYFNANPECENTPYGKFDSKFYYDILIDDKAGFDAETDWKVIRYSA